MWKLWPLNLRVENVSAESSKRYGYILQVTALGSIETSTSVGHSSARSKQMQVQNMPGACLTSIKIKSLIALIVSVPLHLKQPRALPQHFNCVLAEFWACWEKTSGRVIKGREKIRGANLHFHEKGSKWISRGQNQNNCKPLSLHQ